MIKREDGFIDITNYEKKQDESKQNNYWVNINNSSFYFKRVKQIEKIYNELVAEEFAKIYGLASAHYDLVFEKIFDEKNIGVISKKITKENEKLILMDLILENKQNNLSNIENQLKIRYGKYYKILLEKIYNLFIFDVLTGQGDRHSLNYGIIKGKKIFFSPLFDSEYILSSDSINEGSYSLGIDDNDKEGENLLEKFV